MYGFRHALENSNGSTPQFGVGCVTLKTIKARLAIRALLKSIHTRDEVLTDRFSGFCSERRFGR